MSQDKRGVSDLGLLGRKVLMSGYPRKPQDVQGQKGYIGPGTTICWQVLMSGYPKKSQDIPGQKGSLGPGTTRLVLMSGHPRMFRGVLDLAGIIPGYPGHKGFLDSGTGDIPGYIRGILGHVAVSELLYIGHFPECKGFPRPHFRYIFIRVFRCGEKHGYELVVGVCCCLQTCNLVVNMAVVRLVLGQSLMVISTTGTMLQL